MNLIDSIFTLMILTLSVVIVVSVFFPKDNMKK
jgi:cbb3-type cytochrome oxidase subunit 3